VLFTIDTDKLASFQINQLLMFLREFNENPEIAILHSRYNSSLKMLLTSVVMAIVVRKIKNPVITLLVYT